MKTISVFLAFCAVFIFSSFQKIELPYQSYFRENTAIGLPVQTGCLEAEILLISDWSRSIKGYQDLTKDALYSFVDGLELSEKGIRIGLITFAVEAVLDVSLTSDKSMLHQSLNNLLDRTPAGNTNMADALTLMIKEFSEHGRKNVRHIAIIISDGIPDEEQKVKMWVNIARYDYRIFIYTVNTSGDEGKPEVLKGISSGKGFYVDTNYEGLKQALKNLDFCI